MTDLNTEQPIRVHAADFVDFSLSVAQGRLREVRAATDGTRDYHDFYRQLRAAIVDMHLSGRSSKVLDQFLLAQTDDRRRRIYPGFIRGYRRFLAEPREHGIPLWFAPPTVIFAMPGALEVVVAPDIGLVIENVPHLIQLHFRGATTPIPRRRIDVHLALLESALRPNASGAKVALLDVLDGTLHVAERSVLRAMSVLRGDAAAFSMIAREM